MRVLIVEDNDTLSQAYCTIVRAIGHVVETAFDGQCGLRKLKTFQPHLVLLDMIMPSMNGVEFLDRWKSQENPHPTKVILLTNLSYQSEVETALQLGASEYYLKADLDPDQLRKIIEKYEHQIAQ